ncbi:MAG TPA: A24 family peptidase [Pirellulaceae bacterium]|nr:A24 family peptidase [Pirellulaceae bacterium]HMO92085.1 A24 family peptidase [Pirellulaceae bacterium]HMP69327.1 A24 family peptidase [Pirellulaceae bacterium]
MYGFESLTNGIIANWPYWFVSIVLVVAAVIDGVQLKVPNWITFPMIITGWIYSAVAYAMAGDAWWAGLGWSLAGTAVGLLLLLPAYAIGGMGAGDVKLLAGVGAWTYVVTTFYAFCLSAVIGAAIAVIMVLARRGVRKHSMQFMMILNEITEVRNPETLAALAAKRKSQMLLLPYGIPIAIGTIAYFAWVGLLV